MLDFSSEKKPFFKLFKIISGLEPDMIFEEDVIVKIGGVIANISYWSGFLLGLPLNSRWEINLGQRYGYNNRTYGRFFWIPEKQVRTFLKKAFGIDESRKD